jgi:glycerol uptake facilitator-like aquaporin
MSEGQASLGARAAAEFGGTAALLCVVIGSGIMAERLSGGNVAVALLANTLATVFGLIVLIETLGPISGAHFNPVVTLSEAFFKQKVHIAGVPRTSVAIESIAYVGMQLAGAAVGAWLAHVMFELPILQLSSKARLGPALWLAEGVATFCLLFVIARCGCGALRMPPSVLVASTIGAAYWFTASTSFANPAAVVGRMLSDSFAGISPASALPFVVAQFVGGFLGAWAGRSISRPAASTTQ